jgi:hypothetical protein
LVKPLPLNCFGNPVALSTSAGLAPSASPSMSRAGAAVFCLRAFALEDGTVDAIRFDFASAASPFSSVASCRVGHDRVAAA